MDLYSLLGVDTRGTAEAGRGGRRDTIPAPNLTLPRYANQTDFTHIDVDRRDVRPLSLRPEGAAEIARRAKGGFGFWSALDDGH